MEAKQSPGSRRLPRSLPAFTRASARQARHCTANSSRSCEEIQSERCLAGARRNRMTTMDELLGLGLYTVSEASHLTKVSAGRIRRWVKGYSFTTPSGQTHWSPPVWHPEIEDSGEALLTFKDLIEIRFVNAFLENGIRWPVIRRSAERARSEFKTSHPFSTRRVLMLGSRLFSAVEQGERRALLNLADGQYGLKRIIEPLLHGVVFRNDEPEMWWPMGERRRVVIDPQRSFGRPIDNKSSIPTRVLNAAFRAEKSFKRVANWYGADPQSVKFAVQFEASLAA